MSYRVNPIYQTQAWKRASRAVLARDGWRCQIKGPGCLGEATTVDHIVELADGGPAYDRSNLQAACRPCNSRKGNFAAARRAIPLRKW